MRAIALAAGLAAWLLPDIGARADESRFAVVDLTADPAHGRLVAEIEKDVARLKPGARPLDDLGWRKLLATGEGPEVAATRLAAESLDRRKAGDCATAVPRALEAETLILGSVSLDDERDLLRGVYSTLVACEHESGRIAERDRAARHLRTLASGPPADLPPELWETVVAPIVPAPGSVELHVDSEPANAQIQVNLRGEGATPRTLKVPPGLTLVEAQKDGYRKAFRRVEVGRAPTRVVFRLIERTRDRQDQALAAMSVLRKADLSEKPRTLSELAQYARVDTLVVLVVEGERVRLRFFDAERGALSRESIDSPFDAATGRVAALAARPTPPAGVAEAASPSSPPAGAAIASPGTAPTPLPTAAPPADTAAAGLPEAQAKQQVAEFRRRTRPGAPWWGWVIAGAIGASLLLFVYFDRPQKEETLAVRATWNGRRD